jgi:ATP-dependent RNA helicase DDX19/DBP5
VLVLCHIRELSAQIADVYSKLTKFSDITVANHTATGKVNDAHICIMTMGGLKNALNSRSKVLDLSHLKVVVIDEVDFFFRNEQDRKALFDINNKHFAKQLPKLQWLLFSATYPEDVTVTIDEFCKDAYQIALKNEKLQLDHIDHYEHRCEPKKKIDFIMKVFNELSLTQSIIFVNTKKFCETVMSVLRKNGYKATIMFGDMSNEERDEMMAKFRSGEVNVIVTTNLLARGIDVPEIEIVINFDVPFLIPSNGEKQGDAENYMHRIGRTGRFGTRGMAVSIYDRDEDKKHLDQIMAHYSMQDKLKKLECPEQLKELYEKLHQL